MLTRLTLFTVLFAASLSACAQPQSPPTANVPDLPAGSRLVPDGRGGQWVVEAGKVLPRSEALPRTMPMDAGMAAFLEAAYVADRIDDPLARCLAYPDLPGSQWTKAQVRAQCEQALAPRLTGAQLADFITRGDFAGLDARMRADLALHFRDNNPGEVIHSDYAGITASAEWDRLTARWLEAMPQSGFAVAARAVSFRMRAQEVRGIRLIHETPPEAIAAMRELAIESIAHYRQALALEPRLLSAHTGLINVARLVGDDEATAWAFEQATRIDPGCQSVANARMGMLQPRWGGDWGAMQAYAQELAPLVSKRPLLAMLLHAAEEDRADYAIIDHDLATAKALLEPAIAQSPSLDAVRLMRWVRRTEYPYWGEVALLLTINRFCACVGDEAGRIGDLLVGNGANPAWGESYLDRGLAANPDDLELLSARGHARLKRGALDDAVADLRRVLPHPQLGQMALSSMTRELVKAGRAADALAVVDGVNRAEPANARAWWTRYDVLDEMMDPTRYEALERYLATVDRTDAQQAMIIESAEKMLRERE